MSDSIRAFMPAEIRSLAVTPTERYVLLGVGCFCSTEGMYGSIEWFAQWLNLNRSQVSRAISKLLAQGLLSRKITRGGRYALQLNECKIAKSMTNSHSANTQKSEVVQQGPIFEPSDVFKSNYITNEQSQEIAQKQAVSYSSKSAGVTNSHTVANCHGECDDLSQSSVTNSHAYIQSKIQSKYSKYITYGADNFLCTYDEQGKLIDARYVGKAHEADACIKNKISNSQNLDLEKIPLENKCDELKGCDLACTAPRLLNTVVSTSGTEQADSTAKKERDIKNEKQSFSGSTSNGATELLSSNPSSGDITSSEINIIATEGGLEGTNTQAHRDLPDDGQSHNDLTIGNKSSHVTPVEEQQKTQALSGNAFCASSVATQGLLTDANAAKSSGAGEIKSSSKTSSFEPRIKHQDILDCLKRVYSLEGEIAEECAQEVEKRFGGERNWRWGYRAMTTDDLFQVCYWPVVNRFGREYVLTVQKANGIPCKKFKSRKTSGKTYAQAKQPGLNVAKAASAYGNAKPVAQATKCIPRAQRTIFQIMEDAKAKQGVTPQFNSEGYLTNACSLDDLDNWRKTVAA